MNPIVLIVGTRPEGIKMLPVYFALKKAHMPVIICSTNQHNQLLSEVFSLCNVTPDIELNIMKPGQDLFYITTTVLEKIKTIFTQLHPSLVVVQGDTTTTMACALGAFYLNIPVAHVEAGLRTDTITRPFPEEMNRRLVTMITTLHYAPTWVAYANLLAEGVARSSIACTGNTVVDMLRIMQEHLAQGRIKVDVALQTLVEHSLRNHKKLILLTAHRRESFNGGLTNIMQAFKTFARNHPDTMIMFPYHPNPHVLQAIKDTCLTDESNIILLKPLLYKDLIYLLSHSALVATDSGGIYEEAISLGKRTLILRQETERNEGIWAGLAALVGTDTNLIISTLQQWYDHDPTPTTHASVNVYGDGHAAEKIAQHIQSYLTSTVDERMHEASPSLL